MSEHCDWCNTEGHHATAHREARAEMRAWEREARALEFPFGDHKEEAP